MENCIFCRIISGEIPSLKVYEDAYCIAALDINPGSPGHTLIIPRVHRKDLLEMDEALAGKLMMTAREIGGREMERLGADGFNIVQNNGIAAGQTIPHFHIHVIPRYHGDGKIVAWEPTSPDIETLREFREKLC
ncbi:MAG: HIT family protein [Lachnospiraceae bacterium]|nr:HIT family protein [Lachnospiraceae bacterium]